MPTYTFLCSECKSKYDDITSYDDTEKYESVECPKCGSHNKERITTVCGNFMFSDPVGTDKWNNSHDYRFKHKAVDVKAEREAAEKVSKTGSDPYQKIDDLNKDSNYDFGKI